MKKKIALTLAIVFIIALFTGCGGTSDNSSTTSTEPTASASTGDNAATSSEDANSPYHFAKGNFEFNDAGYTDSAYDYELPLSTTDEVFTYWTTIWTPQYIPSDGLASMPTQKEQETESGVHIEYDVISSDTRAENFSVLLAADNLDDIMDQAMYFYTDSASSAIDDGWLVNFYDYKDYMPNYLYQLWSRDDPDVLKYGRVDDTTWPAMYGMLVEPEPGSGYMLRQDWLDKLNLGKAEDINTFDEWHNILTAFKNDGVEWPLEIYKTVELTAGSSFSGYNTSCLVSQTALPYAKVIDGKVQFTLTTSDDKDLATLINQWYGEGLIDPNYASYTSNQDMTTQITTGATGCVVFNPSEVESWESSSTDSNASWMPTQRIRKSDDQILEYGQKQSNFHYGSASISAKCENIPLVCTWLDWKWSPDGCLLDNWGVEGITWEYNDAGERQLTDFVLNNPDGLGASWVMVLYCCDGLRNPCLNIHKRGYAYPGGEKYLAMFQTWHVDDYGGDYDYPTSITYTTDQQQELATYSNDIVTYISEHYFAFLDGSEPISNWDNYISQLTSLGLDKCQAIYQSAYEAYEADSVT